MESSRSLSRRKCRHMDPDFRKGSLPKYIAPAKGAQSLLSIARRNILWTLKWIDSDSLRNLSEMELRRLWKWIQIENLDSLAIWKAFVGTGKCNWGFEKSLRLGCPSCASLVPRGLSSMCGDVNSNWLVNLTVGNFSMSNDGLVGLSELPNLQCAFFYSIPLGYSTGFSDRVLREWAIAARNKGALSKLKMLLVQGHKEITTWSMGHLSSFPALNTFGIYLCGFPFGSHHESGREWGWYLSKSKFEWYTSCIHASWYTNGTTPVHNNNLWPSALPTPVLTAVVRNPYPERITNNHEETPSRYTKHGLVFKRNWSFVNVPDESPVACKKQRVLKHRKLHVVDEFFNREQGTDAPSQHGP